MNRKSAVALMFVLSACGSLAAMRPAPAYLKSAVAYQIALRCFTREGNFKGATEMLEHGVHRVEILKTVFNKRQTSVSPLVSVQPRTACEPGDLVFIREPEAP